MFVKVIHRGNVFNIYIIQTCKMEICLEIPSRNIGPFHNLRALCNLLMPNLGIFHNKIQTSFQQADGERGLLPGQLAEGDCQDAQEEEDRLTQAVEADGHR